MKITLSILLYIFFLSFALTKPPTVKYYDVNDTLTYNKHISEEIAKYSFCIIDTGDVVTDYDTAPYCISNNKVELLKFIYKNERYPSLAREKNIQGTVLTRFTINENGEICNFQIIEKMGYGLDEETIRVISLLPKWQPAIKDNKPVKTYFELPVKYKLQ